MYGKLIGGCLYPAPRRVTIENFIVYNPTEEQISALGYLPVTFTEEPSDPPTGYIYESGWTEQEEAIVQTWTLVPMPDEVDDAEAYNIIFGGREA